MKKLVISILLLGGFQSAYASGTGDATNIRFSPLGLLVGSISLNLDFKVSTHWTLGPEVRYWKLSLSSNDDISYDVYALGGGVRANWFANGIFTDGLYFGPAVTFARTSIKANSKTDSATYDRTAPVAAALVGYAWYWTSFNIHLGGGATVDLNDQPTNIKTSDGSTISVRASATQITAEFSLGWTF